MNKKILAVMLALVVCFSCVSALAGPSKTTSNVVSTTSSSSNTYVEPVAEVVVTQATAETQQILTEIEEAIAGGAPVVEYFGEEAAELIKAAVGDKADALKLNELVPVVSTGKVTGATSVTIRTAASYTKDDAVVVLAGVTINGKKVWTPLTYVIVDGKLVVTFPEDIAALLADGVVDLAILSDKAA